MPKSFSFIQGTTQVDGAEIQFARIGVPGCGRNERDDAPVILIEINQTTGKIELNVYGDIQSTEPTHTISLGDAKLGKKKVQEEPVKEEVKLEPKASMLTQVLGKAKARRSF